MRVVRELRAAAALVVLAAAGLWTVDVLVNLRLAERSLVASQLAADALDYVGLLIAELQVAIVLAAGALLGGALASRLPGSADRRSEAMALWAAALAGLAAKAAGPAWVPLAALLVWGGFRLLGVRRRRSGRPLPRIGAIALLPALAVGYAAQVPERPGLEGRLSGGLALASAILFAGTVLLDSRRRSRAAVGLGWLLPLVAAGALAGRSVLAPVSLPGEIDPSHASGRRPPHIVLIVLDTVRADHLRSYGYAGNPMPALERWSGDALVAKRAVSAAGWTAPAHASIFSGRTVSRHGIHYAGGRAPSSGLRTLAFDGIRWLPEVLAGRGYDTIAVTANPLALPEEVSGFDRRMAPERPSWGGTLAALGDRMLGLTAATSERLRWRMPYVDARGIADLAMRSVPPEAGPVFLFVNFLDAHSPYNPPRSALDAGSVAAEERLFDRYLDHRQLTRLWSTLPEGRHRYLNELYDGELRWLDRHLERLLAWAGRRFGENLAVIVTSDHGEELGREGRIGHELGLSQELIHVPLFLRLPGSEGGEIEELVEIRRLYDLIASLASGQRPGIEPLVPAAGEAVVSERYRSSYNIRFFGSGHDRDWVSMIDGGVKAVGPSAHGLALYDVGGPGFREVPLPGGPRAEAWRGRVDDYWERHRDRRDVRGSSRALGPEEKERLRSLGYIQ